MQREVERNVLVTLGAASAMGSGHLHNITAASIIRYRSGPTSCFVSWFFNSLDVRRLTGWNPFALRFQIAVDGRRNGLGLPVRCVPPGRRGDGSHGGVAKTHVSWWGDLPPQGGQVTCHEAGLDGKRRGEGGHRDVAGVPDGRVRRRRRYPRNQRRVKTRMFNIQFYNSIK